MSDVISRSEAIDRIAEFLGPKGLDQWEVMVEIREIIENVSAIDAVPAERLGEFGKLFVDYKGCPRGAMGRLGGVLIEEEVLYMKPITDVDGGHWIPVNEDALHELVSEYKKRVPVVHARWIVKRMAGETIAFQCSACENFDNPSKVKGNYCWKCGARMDGEADA